MNLYAFTLGRQPNLAAAEILARLRISDPESRQWNVLAANDEVLIVEIKGELDIEALFHRLGGSIKLGRVKQIEPDQVNPEWIASFVQEQIGQFKIDKSQKLLYGLSVYGHSIPDGVRDLPKEVKKYLSGKNVTSRYIEPIRSSPRILSSAQVVKTGLLKNGIEVLLVFNGSDVFLGYTIQVQEFEEFSHRDYGKPKRLIDPGLLPPKLARILLNLAEVKEGGSIIDPFCGSGVLLAEGLLIGYIMTGNDIDSEAVQASQKNLAWIKEQYPDIHSYEVFKGEAEQLVSRFGPFAFDSAVGEGDLGPIFRNPITKKDTNWLVKRYKKMYTACLAELRSLVRPGGRVILALPYWKLKDGREVGLELKSWARFMGYREADLFEGCKVPSEWTQGPVVYRRPGQITAREIYCLIA